MNLDLLDLTELEGEEGGSREGPRIAPQSPMTATPQGEAFTSPRKRWTNKKDSVQGVVVEQSDTGRSSAQRTEQMGPVGEVHNNINIAMGGAGSSQGDWMQTIFGYAGSLLSIMLSLF